MTKPHAPTTKVGAPNQQPRYYDTRSSRRTLLLGVGAGMLLSGGGAALWLTKPWATDGIAGEGGTVDVNGDLGDVRDVEPAPRALPVDVAAASGGDPSPFTSVAMVGDSITRGSQPLLEEVLAARGVTDLRIDGVPSRRIEIGSGNNEPLSGIRTLFQLLSEGVAPDAWVIALGTNDVGQYADDAEYVRLIDSITGMIAADLPLVWVDVYRPEYIDASRTFNQLVRERLAARGNARVADWFSRASDDSLRLLQGDRIHPNDNGRLVFAAIVADAIADLNR